MSRLFLKFCLCLHVAIAPSLQLWAATPPKRVNLTQGFIQKLSHEAMEDRVSIQKWIQAADAVEAGVPGRLPNYDPNIFQMANQRVEILEEGEFSLNDRHLDLPAVSFTSLKVVYDQESRELVFEGYRGVNDRGENGELVARHIIPDMDIASMVNDEEMVQIVDSQGRLHAIDMTYVSQSVFSSVLPMAKNIWEPKRLPEKGDYDMHFATLGVEPPDIDLNDENLVLPVNEKGEVDIRAGDTIVYRYEGGKKVLAGIFSRQVTYYHLNRSYETLYEMLKTFQPANLSPSRISAVEKLFARVEEVEEFEAQVDTVPQVIRRALRNVSENQMGVVFGPKKIWDESEDTGAYQANDRRSQRQFQQLTETKWRSAYRKIRATADQQSESLARELGDESLSVVERDNLEYQKSVLDGMRGSGDLSAVWRDLYNKTDMNIGLKHKKDHHVSRLKELAEKYNLNRLVPLLATGVPIAAIWSFPLAYENSEAAQQVQAMSWIYEHYPAVLKDASYRISPLLLSTLSVLAIWPAAVGNSVGLAAGFKLWAKKLQNSTTKLGRAVRDFSHKWSDLTPWQFLISAGMRGFGLMIYPVGRIVVSQLLRQKGFVTAHSAGLNPLLKVAADSPLGKKAGLTRDRRLGISNPFLRGDKSKADLDQQKRLQSVLADRKQRIDNMAWTLAATLVSQEKGIDAATIELVASGKVAPTNLEAAFAQPETQRLWLSTQGRLQRYLEGMASSDLVSGGEAYDDEQMSNFYQYALELAESLKGQSASKVLLDNLWARSRLAFSSSVDVLFNFGLKDSKFLRSVFTNSFVSEQTRRGFVSDHVLVALAYALVGQRADLSQPHLLAADSNGLAWTNGPHWSDVGNNTYAHFLSSGSKRALIYQSVKPKDSQLYVPEEYLWADAGRRREGFFVSLSQWVLQVADPRKSNIGYFSVKAFQKRFNTLAAGIYINLLTRCFLGDQSPANALMGFTLFLLAGQWFYGWPWDIIDRGARGEGERLDHLKDGFQKVLADLSESFRAADDSDESRARIEEGLNSLFGFYQKYNPKALEALEAFAEDPAVLVELQEQLGAEALDENLIIRLGLAAEIRMAEAVGDSEAKESARSELLQALKNGGATLPELEKLGAMALQEYALSELPIFTEPSPAPTWIMTFVVGAVLTTIMAIPLSVLSFDDAAFAAARAAEDPSLDPNEYYLKPQNLAFWAGVSAFGYGSTYLLLNKNGFLAKIIDRVEAWKKSREKSCSGYFSREKS